MPKTIYQEHRETMQQLENCKAMLESIGYKVNHRTFADIEPLCKGAYSMGFYLEEDDQDDYLVYSGMTHNPANRQAKLPNVTILKNLQALGGLVMGCTMGHHQANERFPIMEIYEFLGYGAMIIDIDGKPNVEMHVAKPGSKVIIPSGCSMTMYNLGLEDLVTHDFANAYDGNNDGTKKLQKKAGPVMAIVYDKQSIEFRISLGWVNRGDGHGVELEKYNVDDLVVCVGVNGGNLGQELNELLTEDNGVKERFEKIGVKVVEAGTSFSLDGQSYSEPLFGLALGPEKVLHRYFHLMGDGDK